MAKIASGQPIRSAEFLLQVLNCFGEASGALSITEISRTLDLAISTVRPLLITLEREGFVRQEESGYKLGTQVIRLAAAGLAREFSDQGITVNSVAPGLVAETEFTGAWPQSRIDGIVSEIRAERAGSADEIAATIAFLCSQDAGFITGEVINQNGGWRFGG